MAKMEKLEKLSDIIRKSPQNIDFESVKILKKVNLANKALAELKGISKTIPNSEILINTLILQEAKYSSEIENIITTHDDLYKSDIDINEFGQSAKEVKDYSLALKKGFELISENKILIIRYILQIQEIIEKNRAGIRTQSGTVLKNPQTGKVIYTPPQDFDTINGLLKDLENYINVDDKTDPLIKMSIIHYQFESIHPFYDGNGRTGRIINILYLVLKNLLDIPILYLSGYIIKTKSNYYRLLQDVRNKCSWEEWILYMLEGVEKTSLETTNIINGIKKEMFKVQNLMIEKIPKIYSKDLLETLFLHPYTKIEFLVRNLNISRQTASKYLKQLEEIGILKKAKIKNWDYYINISLFSLLSK